MAQEDHQIIGYTLTFDPDQRTREIEVPGYSFTADFNQLTSVLVPELCAQVALYPGTEKQRSQRRSTFPTFLRESDIWNELASDEYLLLLVVQSYLTLVDPQQLPRTYRESIRKTYNHHTERQDQDAATAWWALAQFCATLD